MGLTHPTNMSPEMREIQRKAGLLCDACKGSGKCVVFHGVSHPASKGRCLACNGTGRKHR